MAFKKRKRLKLELYEMRASTTGRRRPGPSSTSTPPKWAAVRSSLRKGEIAIFLKYKLFKIGKSRQRVHFSSIIRHSWHSLAEGSPARMRVIMDQVSLFSQGILEVSFTSFLLISHFVSTLCMCPVQTMLKQTTAETMSGLRSILSNCDHYGSS